MAREYLKKATLTSESDAGETQAIVTGILKDIEAGGDKAAMEYAAKFDRYDGNVLLTAEEIEAALGQPLVMRDAADPLTAPGQLLSHYAPNARVRLNATSVDAGELLLGFGPMECDLNLSESADLAEAASNLFDHLHRLDKSGRTIAVAPVPDHGLGHAINDRLERAAAPRQD